MIIEILIEVQREGILMDHSAYSNDFDEKWLHYAMAAGANHVVNAVRNAGQNVGQLVLIIQTRTINLKVEVFRHPFE